jgi:hypothetical protein
MAFDDVAIVDAIAARFVAYGAPAGQTLRASYAVPIDGLSISPAIIVYPSSDTVTYGAANRQVTAQFIARCYIPAQGDTERRYRTLLLWRSHLRDAFNGAVLLSGNVSQISVTGTSIGQDTYADNEYLVVEVNLEATKVEAINVAG